MNSSVIRRIAQRDYARRNRMRDSTMEMRDEHKNVPTMYSNEYTMGGGVHDSNSRNRYTPRGFDSRQSDYERGYSESSEYDSAYGNDKAFRNGEFDGHYYYPFEVAGRYGKVPYPMQDMRNTQDMHNPYLTEQELKQWEMRLLHSLESADKQMLEKQRVVKEAEELGIRFDKFTKEEFYVVVLMMYTDFCKTLGTARLDTYLKLAKDWLTDDDIAVRYSEKLSAYYDHIVEGA